MKRHMQVHTFNRPRPFACQKCDQHFYASNTCNRHEIGCKAVRRIEEDGASTNSESREKLKGSRDHCKVCDMPLMQNSLEDHMQSHIINRPQPFACHKCEQGFYAIRDLQEHELSCQDISKVKEKTSAINNPEKCHFCPESFRTKLGLKLHLKGHGTRFTCATCGASFNAKTTVFDHQQRAHSNQQGFGRKCNTSNNENGLLNEQGVRHESPPGPSGSPRANEKRLKVDPTFPSTPKDNKGSCSYLLTCSKCSLGFAEMSELRKHIQICAPSPVKENTKFDSSNDSMDFMLN